MKSLEQLLSDFEPLFRKLTNNPLKSFKDQKPIYLTLTKEEKEDLYHELQCEFIMLYQNYDLTRKTPFPGYVKTKLGWHAHHYAEKVFDKRKFELPIDLDLIESEDQDSELEREINEELSFNMIEAIETLPTRQKQVVNMFFILNMSMKEIAETLEIHVDECYRHRKLGIKKLKKKINLP